MIKIFRIIAFLEGVSYILLLFIATPIKYILGNDLFVKILGMPHGILFLIYIALVFYIASVIKWDKKIIFLFLIASIVPFGTFYLDRKYFK